MPRKYKEPRVVFSIYLSVPELEWIDKCALSRNVARSVIISELIAAKRAQETVNA